MEEEIDIEGDEEETLPAFNEGKGAAETQAWDLSSTTPTQVESRKFTAEGDPSLLQQYPEPGWLSDQTTWASTSETPDMDDQSRALIESMLAEEEFYFGQGTVTMPPPSAAVVSADMAKTVTKRVASDSDDSMKKKPRRERLAKATGASHKLKWTKEEDECLREGIQIHGYGSWKQIATFMQSRTPLQVKNHVRHLTVHSGVKFEGGDSIVKEDTKLAVESTNLPNTEQESDIEDIEVDITDEDDDDEMKPHSLSVDMDARPHDQSATDQTEEESRINDCDVQNIQEIVRIPKDEASTKAAASDVPKDFGLEVKNQGAEAATPQRSCAEAVGKASDTSAVDVKETPDTTYKQESLDDHSELPKSRKKQNFESPPERTRASISATVKPGATQNLVTSNFSDTQDDIIVHHPLISAAKSPTTNDTSNSESGIDRESIQQIEVSSLPEWFLSTLALAQGKKPHPRTLHKTPERYQKIRNFILNAWDKCKPKYLTKTSVRPGLKGEGDVNAIGRIHEFLENVGAINVGCPEKGGRRSYGASSTKKPKEELEDDMTEFEAGSVWSFMEERRRRKRKVRNSRGDWVDEDCLDQEETSDTETSAEVMSAREEQRLFALNSKYFADEELEKFDKKLLKRRQRQRGFTPSMGATDSDVLGEYDPFRLIPMRTYTEEIVAPFRVEVQSNAMIVMDLHAHLAHTEIIGLLGGIFDADNLVINVLDVFPCRSMSTGVQCEMDPDSEMQAREVFAGKGYDVVGWYHSHPTFDPIPSIRDIENQIVYQTLFQKASGVEPFIGAIVTPYDARYASDRRSRFAFLSISHQWNSLNEYRLPYQCRIDIVGSDMLGSNLFEQLTQLLREYRNHEHRVDLLKPYAPRYDPNFTRVDKLIHSLGGHASLTTADESEPFLSRLRAIVLKGFCGVQPPES
ncbi:SWIRM domain-containing protein [Phlyctochytrium arcticum]|nr:SWIRM domain-containing protein [Phlyctochytrium arcticum]